jgi:cytoskeletal protein CcmA (bactofilin family)
MVFRRETKVDAFQRQISALRQQIGPEENEDDRGEPQRGSSDSFQRPGSFSGGDSGSNSYGFSEFGGNAPGGAANEEPVDPELPAAPIVDANTTVIAGNATWKGELQSDGAVHVHGRFEGSIRATEDIFVAEEADVDATLLAANVVIAGAVKGNVRCSSRFEILPTGRVSGEIQSPTLVVHEGANVTGQFRMGAPEAVENVPTPVTTRRAARGVS